MKDNTMEFLDYACECYEKANEYLIEALELTKEIKNPELADAVSLLYLATERMQIGTNLAIVGIRGWTPSAE